MCGEFRLSLCAAAVLVLVLSVCSVNVNLKPEDVTSLTFLMSVHAPWSNCFATVKTPVILPMKDWRNVTHVDVGGCDWGPLTFVARNNTSPDSPCSTSSMNVAVVFYSTEVAASPPACVICWNGTYLTPHTMWANESLLPGCETSDSDEGYHMTYYWFHIMSWTTK
ncbi:uncharacterized protein [Haliotis asinina]|uniref:uncharacterized protein n=1 Tax=Haliotis asinina TaxID=109174 RepID=UPI0035322451